MRFITPILALLALPLGAYVSLLPEGGDLPPRLSLEAGLPNPNPGEPLGVSLAISDPRTEAVFNTAFVAVQTTPLQYEYLAGAEWTDRAPQLFGLFLERRFENTQRFAAVGDRVALPVADYTLLTDIRALNLDRTGTDRKAVVAFSARIVDRRGVSLANRIFRSEAVLTTTDTGGAIRALNAAATEAVDDVVAWSIPIISVARDESEARAAADAERRANARRRSGS